MHCWIFFCLQHQFFNAAMNNKSSTKLVKYRKYVQSLKLPIGSVQIPKYRMMGKCRVSIHCMWYVSNFYNKWLLSFFKLNQILLWYRLSKAHNSFPSNWIDSKQNVNWHTKSFYRSLQTMANNKFQLKLIVEVTGK